MVDPRQLEQYRMGPDWTEDVELPDGTVVHLRMVRPSDKSLLLDGLRRMSPETRYMRFLTAKDSLTDGELRYLTEVDCVDHVAIGASRLDVLGRVDPLGLARFVRLVDDPTAAEGAVTVVDSFQGRGLGRLLLSRLAEAALERGITRFRATALASNARIRALLEELAVDTIQVDSEGEAMVLDVPLAPPPSAVPEMVEQDDGTVRPRRPRRPLERLLAAVAEGALEMFHVMERWVPTLPQERGDRRGASAPRRPGQEREEE
ncbi:MAG: GNAT family N-acetyltransferase [Myxococcota bacterium]